MATAKTLQTPKILAVDGSTIRIQHPDVTNYVRTYLAAQIAASGTAMSVLDNDGFADDDWFIIGEPGDEKTEENDVNGAVTRGTSVTVTNTLKFAHEVDAPVTRIWERKILIYGASSDGGSLTAIVDTGAALNIQWDKPYTEYVLKTTDTAYSYYVVKFYDGTTSSSASDYIANSGLPYNSAYQIINAALEDTGAKVVDTGEITWPFLVNSVQEAQDYVTQWIDPQTQVKKDWSWEFIDDNASLDFITYENRYALSSLTYEMKYGKTKQSILNVISGKYPTKYVPIDVFDRHMDGKIYAQTSGSNAAGATSLVLDEAGMFSTSGGSVYVYGQTITYTGITSNTLTGVPASGTGSISTTIPAGATCWQTSFFGRPSLWSIYNGYIVFVNPPDSSYSGWPIKVRYIKKLTRITEISDTTEIPFTNVLQYYVCYKIEMKRGNDGKAAQFKLLCDQGIQSNAKSDKSYTTEVYESYRFDRGILEDGRNQNWNSDAYYY